MFEYNEKRYAVTGFDHAVRFDVIMVFVFFNNLHNLLSQSQRFFVDVSFKFSNNRCRYIAYGNCAILLSLMQRDGLTADTTRFCFLTFL